MAILLTQIVCGLLDKRRCQSDFQFGNCCFLPFSGTAVIIVHTTFNCFSAFCFCDLIILHSLIWLHLSHGEKRGENTKEIFQTLIRAGVEKSYGTEISMKANKNQTTWLFPCWKCVIMCCCIVFLASMCRKKEKLLNIAIEFNKKNIQNNLISIMGDEKLFIAKISRGKCWRCEGKTINIAELCRHNTENKIVNAFKKTI